MDEKNITSSKEVKNALKEEKPIVGKTTVDEAKELAEEGIPVIPLPWIDDKVN